MFICMFPQIQVKNFSKLASSYTDFYVAILAIDRKFENLEKTK